LVYADVALVLEPPSDEYPMRFFYEGIFTDMIPAVRGRAAA